MRSSPLRAFEPSMDSFRSESVINPSEIHTNTRRFSNLQIAKTYNIMEVYSSGISPDKIDFDLCISEIHNLRMEKFGAGEDSFDRNSVWFICFSDGKISGCMRQTYPLGGATSDLPLETKGIGLTFIREKLGLLDEKIGEISRLIVRPSSSSGQEMKALIEAGFSHARLNGYNTLLCVARPRQAKLYLRKFHNGRHTDLEIPARSLKTGEAYSLILIDVLKYFEDPLSSPHQVDTSEVNFDGSLLVQ